MKIFLIVVIMLFGACSENVEYVQLIRVNKIKKVPYTINNGFCPKVKDKFLNSYIYAVHCKENAIFFKTTNINSNDDIVLKEYQIMNEKIFLVRMIEFDATVVGKEASPFEEAFMSPYDNYLDDLFKHKVKANNNDEKVSKIINDTSYYYEPNSNGFYKIKFIRYLDGSTHTKDREYGLGLFDKIGKNLPIYELLADIGKELVKKELSRAIYIFQKYDSRFKSFFYNKNSYELEGKLNIDLDFTIKYQLDEKG